MKHTPSELAEIMRGKSVDSYDSRNAALFDRVAEQLDCLSRVHAELDGQEWGSDTAGNIADYLGAAGLECRDPGSCDCDDRSWHGDEHDTLCPLAGLSRS